MKIYAVIAYSKLLRLDISISDALDIISKGTGMPVDRLLCYLDVLKLDEDYFEGAVAKIKNKVPIAYITGRKEFYGLEFDVTEDTLIPRPETEILVEEALKIFKGKEDVTVLDLFTGGGCILLSLLYNLRNSIGLGIDISKEALKVAKKNARKFYLHENARFMPADLRKGLTSKRKFDLITVNPPYLSEKEYEDASSSLYFEPKSALVAGDDGLLFYKLLLSTLPELGNNGSYAFFEVGYTQAEKVASLYDEAGYDVEIIKDLAGTDRVVKCRFKE